MPDLRHDNTGITNEFIDAMHRAIDDPGNTSLLHLLLRASDGLTYAEAQRLYDHLATRLSQERDAADAHEDLLITEEEILALASKLNLGKGTPAQLRWSLTCREARELLAQHGMPAFHANGALSRARLQEFLRLFKASSVCVPGFMSDTRERKLLEALIGFER